MAFWTALVLVCAPRVWAVELDPKVPDAVPSAAAAVEPAEPAAQLSLAPPALAAALPEAAALSAAVPAAVAAAGLDETAVLKAHQQAVRRAQPARLSPEARVHKFLFIPGFSWDSIPNYFEPNIRRLRGLGLDAELVPVHPLAPTSENWRAVAAAVKAAPGPVVLIGHSKGGIDAIEAVRRDRSVRKKVTRVVAVQSPYGGAAVADWFLERPWLAGPALVYTRLLAPARILAVSPFFRKETLRQLSRRRRYAEAGRPPWRSGPALYSIGSRVGADTAIKLLLWVTAGTVKAMTGQDNDGIVSPQQALIPGSRQALLEHVGHIDTISEPSQWRHKILGVRAHDPSFAADLTEAIVRWLFAPPPAGR